METPESGYPRARHSGLLIDHVRDETIVYDEDRQEAHTLNRAASLVWTHSDGTRSVPELAVLLGRALGSEPDESIIEYALDELSRVHLLEDDGREVPVSRRDVLRRLTFAGATAIAVPAVLSIVVPTPAMASSGIQNAQGQNNNNQGGN